MVYGGVSRGDELGRVEFLLDGEVVKSCPLYADDDVAAEQGSLSWWERALGALGIYV